MALPAQRREGCVKSATQRLMAALESSRSPLTHFELRALFPDMDRLAFNCAIRRLRKSGQVEWTMEEVDYVCATGRPDRKAVGVYSPVRQQRFNAELGAVKWLGTVLRGDLPGRCGRVHRTE